MINRTIVLKNVAFRKIILYNLYVGINMEDNI